MLWSLGPLSWSTRGHSFEDLAHSQAGFHRTYDDDDDYDDDSNNDYDGNDDDDDDGDSNDDDVPRKIATGENILKIRDVSPKFAFVSHIRQMSRRR